MKKMLSSIIAICMLVGLAACGTPPGIAESRQQDTDTLSDSDTASESDSESWLDVSSATKNSDTDTETDVSDTDVIPENASEFAIELHERYSDLSSENGFKVSNVTYSNEFTEFSLIFGDFENNVRFYKDEKSFEVSVNNDAAAKSQIKKVMAQIIMGIDDITADEAEKISQSIANSYSSDTFSDTQDVGEYLIVLLPDESKYSNPFKYLKCIHKDELWEEIDESEYPVVDRAMYEAPELNISEKCKVTGTVKEWHFDCFYDTLYKGVVSIETDNGDEYCCQYLYEYAPVSLEQGAKYTIYGTIENGFISVDYPEKLN